MQVTDKVSKAIVDALASHFVTARNEERKWTIPRLAAHTRSAASQRCRAEIMYVLHRCGLSLPAIGRLMERDHTSVLYNVRRVKDRIKTQVGYRAEVDELMDIARGVLVKTQRKERMRERLPEEREGQTHRFEIMASRPGADLNAPLEDYTVVGYIQTGEYPGGRLGEVFVKFGKHGDFHAMLDQWAIAVSVALQHGASVDNLFGKFVSVNFPPSGHTNNKDIPTCTSIVDYVAKYCLSRYGAKTP